MVTEISHAHFVCKKYPDIYSTSNTAECMSHGMVSDEANRTASCVLCQYEEEEHERLPTIQAT